jgi:hypothetical protein
MTNQIHDEGWGERLLRALSGEPDPDPRILNSSAEMPRPVRLAWWLWLTAIVLIIAGVLWLAGCAAPAPVPPCAVWHADVIVDGDGDLEAIVIDAENIQRLHALVQGLAHGTCRLPEPPIAQKGEQQT